MGDIPRSLQIKRQLYDLISEKSLFPLVIRLDGLILSRHSCDDEIMGHRIAVAYCAAHALAERYNVGMIDYLCIRYEQTDLLIVPVNEEAILVNLINGNFDDILLKMKGAVPQLVKFVY